MKWYLVRAAGSSTSIKGFVKISRKKCDLCDLPIITQYPRAKVICTLVNSDHFDLDFCLIDGAIIFTSKYLSEIENMIPKGGYIQAWNPKGDSDKLNAFVLSSASLPSISLNDGPGIGRLPPCARCHPAEQPNIIYDFAANPVVSASMLAGSDAFRIDGDSSILISEKFFKFLQPLKVGTLLCSYIPAVILSD